MVNYLRICQLYNKSKKITIPTKDFLDFSFIKNKFHKLKKGIDKIKIIVYNYMAN